MAIATYQILRIVSTSSLLLVVLALSVQYLFTYIAKRSIRPLVVKVIESISSRANNAAPPPPAQDPHVVDKIVNALYNDLVQKVGRRRLVEMALIIHLRGNIPPQEQLQVFSLIAQEVNRHYYHI